MSHVSCLQAILAARSANFFAKRVFIAQKLFHTMLFLYFSTLEGMGEWVFKSVENSTFLILPLHCWPPVYYWVRVRIDILDLSNQPF